MKDLIRMKNLTMKYYKQLYVMVKFLKNHNVPKLTQKKRKYDSPIFLLKIEYIVKHFPAKKLPGSNGFTRKSYQTFKEEIIQILSFCKP